MPHSHQGSAVDATDMWDVRAQAAGLHSVFTRRWSAEQCRDIDALQSAAILTLAGSLAGQSVLDLGCGVGRLTGRLASEGAKVVGVDTSPGMIARAKRDVPAVEFFVMKPGVLDFPAASFDCIIASFVFQHIGDDEVFRRTLTECRRVLRAGGRIVMMEGVGTTDFRPANSRITSVRTLARFSEGLGDGMEIDAMQELVLVEDVYTAMRWKESSDAQGG